MSFIPDDNRTTKRGARLLERSLDVLECIASAPEGLQRAAIIEQTGMPRATVARILSVLADRGFVHRNLADRTYLIGLGLLEKMHSSSPMPELVAVGAPELRYLRQATGETAYLAVLEGRSVVSIGKDQGPHSVRSNARLGARKPLHCTSQGKAILATLPDNEQADLLQTIDLAPLTVHTITSLERLKSELAIIKVRGFAIDDEEIEAGVRCVGAPIVTDSNQVIGAVSIAGPTWRLSRERLEMLGVELAAAGKRIGSQLRRFSPVTPSDSLREAVPGAPSAYHGLPPRWCPASGNLWHGDALHPRVRRCRDNEDHEVLSMEKPIRGIELMRRGLFVVLDDGCCVEISRGGEAAVHSSIHLEPSQTVTATAVRPDGTLWLAVRTQEGGAICLVEGTGATVQTVLPDPVDAMVWSPDSAHLIASVAASGTIYRLSVGTWRRQVIARVLDGSGRPQSLALDADGGLWVALADGWAIAHINELGETDQLIAIPVPTASGLAFGGQESNRLYIATARHGPRLDSLAAAPAAGRLLMLETSVKGIRPAVLGAT